jgi:hypothetical protein
MSEAMSPDQDILLSFLRNELDAEAEQALLQRLRQEPVLRDELRWLQEAAGEAFADRYAERGDAAFEQLLQRMPTRPPAATPWQRLCAWWSAHAGVMQGALATLVIAQAIMLGGLWHQRSAPAIYRGEDNNCLTVTVRFRADVTEARIASWLSPYDARFIDGPDADAHYRIRLPDAAALDAFMHDTDGQSLTAERLLPAGCQPRR